MKYHLNKFHPNLKDPDNSQESLEFRERNRNMDIREMFKARTPYKSGEREKVKLDRLLLEMIVADLRPLSTVEMPGFVKFVHALNPRYKLPSRPTITNRLPALYTKEMGKLMSRAEKWNHVGLTTDMWTSSQTTAFLSLTAHYVENGKLGTSILMCNRMEETHTAVNIESFVQQCITRYQLDRKVAAVTTDNAPNMVKAIKDANLVHIPCFAHSLNLCVTQMLKEVDILRDLRAKLSRIVTLTKKSTVARETFMQCQRELGHTTLKVLVQEVPTRWNSTYLMCSRIAEQVESIKLFVERFNMGASIGRLSDEEWAMVDTIIELLKPCYEFTCEMSSERFVSASKVLPMVKILLQFYNLLFETEARARDAWSGSTLRYKIAKCLSTCIRDRLVPYSSIKSLQMATLLDPRFKKIGFKTERLADEAINVLKGEMRQVMASAASSAVSKNSQASSQSSSSMSSLWSMLDTTTERPQDARELERIRENKLIGEVTSWFEEALATKDTDPMTWWSANKLRYPTLWLLAEKYLVIQSTSVPSERLFSSAGQVLSSLRSRLSDDNAEMLIFLNSNLKLDSHGFC